MTSAVLQENRTGNHLTLAIFPHRDMPSIRPKGKPAVHRCTAGLQGCTAGGTTAGVVTVAGYPAIITTPATSAAAPCPPETCPVLKE